MTPRQTEVGALDRVPYNRLVVAVLTTGKRPLAPVLASLRQQSTSLRLVVVCNGVGPWTTAAEIAATHSATLLFEPALGYSSARNTALGLIEDSEALIFFDDDQIALPGWLETFARCASISAADVIFGPVEPRLTARAFGRHQDLRVSAVRPGAEGIEPYSGNTWLRSGWFRESGLKFDLRYNRTGGEDTDFFRRAQAAGAKIRFAQWARAVEMVDPDRLTASGRFRAGVLAGRRMAVLQAPTLGSLTRKPVRASRGALRLVLGVLMGRRWRVGQGLFDLGLSWGYLTQVCQRDHP